MFLELVRYFDCDFEGLFDLHFLISSKEEKDIYNFIITSGWKD